MNLKILRAKTCYFHRHSRCCNPELVRIESQRQGRQITNMFCYYNMAAEDCKSYMPKKKDNTGPGSLQQTELFKGE